MDWALNSLFPRAYFAPLPPPKYDQVLIVNWLALEVDQQATTKMPVLESLTRWRNREVWHWVQDHKEEMYLRYVGML